MYNLESGEPAQQDKKNDRHMFYFETPLYAVVETDDLQGCLLTGEVDGLSPGNGIETTYTISEEPADYHDSNDSFRKVTLTCKRKGEQLIFFVVREGDKCVKIGQAPPLAKIQFGNLSKKYEKVLDKENLFLLKRAIGLAAHGTGAGAFVYLRRIFEGLVKDAFNSHSKNMISTEEDFNKMRMEDKVHALADYLPDELASMSGLYGVLSQGVHELSEEECLDYFPVLKLCIELVLDKKIEEAAKVKRSAEVKRQLRAVQSKIGAKNDR